LTYLVDADIPDAFDLAMRHDAITGNDRQLLAIAGATTLDEALETVQARMPGANLRAWVASRGADGCSIVTKCERWDVPAFPVEVVDTTGAGDAFAAGIAYGLARRWDWPRTGRLANALGALSTRALGSQSALPSRVEVASLLGEDAATLFP
jgi:sugar/nucleoside kinase (ribokinase family)